MVITSTVRGAFGVMALVLAVAGDDQGLPLDSHACLAS